MRQIRIGAAALLAAALVATLGGCAPIVPLEPPADADNPACADVIVRLPDTLADLPRRETNAQATGAWGEPVAVQLYCGVEVPSAAAFPCVEVDGIQWLRNDEQAPVFIFRTYGLEPAVDVVIDTEVAGSFPVLSGLRRAVSTTAPNGHTCGSVENSD